MGSFADIYSSFSDVYGSHLGNKKERLQKRIEVAGRSLVRETHEPRRALGRESHKSEL